MTTATRTPRTTAPLPSAAVKAMANLERSLLPLDMVRAVAHYEAATARYDELVARPASTLSPAEFDALGAAQQTVAEMFGVLAAADRLDLIAPAEAAARYRHAASHCRRLVAVADFDACADVQDEMAMCRCQLAAAGRLDLIEAA